MAESGAAARAAGLDTVRMDLQAICGNFLVEPGAGFDGQASIGRSAGLEIARISLAHCTVRRDRRQISADDVDHYVLILQAQGSSAMQQNGRLMRLRRGDMFLLDAARPSVFNFPARGGEQLCLHLSRSEAEARFGRGLEGGMMRSGGDHLSVATGALLHHVAESGGIEPAKSGMGETFLDLLGDCLHGLKRSGEASGSRTGGLLEQALQRIDADFRDPGFGPGTLAQDLGISPRKLQRVFSALGQSPRERILERRLDGAHDVLCEAKEAKVVDVALGHGFSDLSFFYRAYRRKFGGAPGGARADLACDA